MSDSNGGRSFEDIYDAINTDLAVSRTPRKEMAIILWPGRRPETAMGLFSRAMTPDNTDVHLSIEHLIAIIKHTGGQHTLYYLCDFAKFERPIKKSNETMREEVRREMQDLLIELRRVAKKIDDTVDLET